MSYTVFWCLLVLLAARLLATPAAAAPRNPGSALTPGNEASASQRRFAHNVHENAVLRPVLSTQVQPFSDSALASRRGGSGTHYHRALLAPSGPGRRPSPKPTAPAPPPKRPIPPPPRKQPSRPPPKKQSTAKPVATVLTGKLTQSSDHRQEGIWFLHTGTDPYYTVELPGQPRANLTGYNETKPVALGTTITLTCGLVVKGQGTYACKTVQRVSQLSAAAPVAAVDRSIKVLIINMRMCGGSPRYNASQIYNLYWSNPGHANLMAACSYNKLTYDRDAFRVVDIEMPCDPLLYQVCQTRPYIRREALSRVGAALGVLTFVQYQFYHFVLPPGIMYQCGFSGLAYLVADDVYLVSDPNNGVEDMTTVVQEQIHNFGLYHGWSREGREYNDWTSCMGRAPVCPSAPELWRLGWASSIATLSSDNLAAGKWNTYSIPATSRSDNNHVKVKPDWLGDSYTRNLYVAVRVKANGDSRLDDFYNGKVHLHMANRVIDNDFAAWGDPKVTFYDALTPGLGRYTVAESRVVLHVGARSGDNVTVSMCRYNTDETECDHTKIGGGSAVVANDCMDKNVMCLAWRIRGMCYNGNMTAFVQNECRAACGVCSSEPAPSDFTYIVTGTQPWGSGRCMDILYNMQVPGREIQQYDCNESEAQRFKLERVGTGPYYNIKSTKGMCLDVFDFQTYNGASVVLWPCNGAPNQQFILTTVAGRVDDKARRFQIRPRHALNKNMCLDVASSNPNIGAKIGLWTCNNTPAQMMAWYNGVDPK